MSFQIATSKNIPIKVHFTLIITFVIFAWTISSYFMPQYQEGLSEIEYWIMGIAATIILFVSITLHELAHSLVCIRHKIPVRSITLFIFGGVSDMKKEPKNFKTEFKVAIAGPVVSYVLAGIFASLLITLSNISLISDNKIFENIEPVLYYSALINFMLGTFNLIPAFPLDGGRVFRAIMTKRKKSYYEATKISTKIGIIISYGFMGFGFISLFFGNLVGGIWIILIGWFLNSGAQSYRYQFEITQALEKVPVSKIMKKNVITIEENISVNSAYEDYFKNYIKTEFPIVDKNNELIGAITSKTIKNLTENEMSDSVSKHMDSKKELIIAKEQDQADKILFDIIKQNKGKAFVCNDTGKLVGVISKTDIINTANERQEYFKDNMENLASKSK